MAACKAHNWKKKTLPCPWLRCPNGARGHWIVAGKRKRVIYVRTRTKDEHGPRYGWKKTLFDPNELLAVDDEEDDIVF